jgi:thiosulfate dehydrogenase [quinone] large subunit
MKFVATKQPFEDPGWLKQLFGNPLFGFGWLVLRVYVGLQWLDAGLHKVWGDGSIGWVRDGTVTVTQNGASREVFKNAGDNILASWNSAVGVNGAPPRITFEWYQDFVQFMIDHRWNGWFTYLIAYGEVLIGLGLIVGAFTGFAALFGATMNMNFMLAGTTSSNPVLFMVAIVLLLAWKTAGYVGADRWLLPALGTPWKAGRLFHRTQAPNPAIAPKVNGARA